MSENIKPTVITYFISTIRATFPDEESGELTGIDIEIDPPMQQVPYTPDLQFPIFNRAREIFNAKLLEVKDGKLKRFLSYEKSGGEYYWSRNFIRRGRWTSTPAALTKEEKEMLDINEK